jgi:gluconolactonase
MCVIDARAQETNSPTTQQLIGPDAKVEKLATGMQFIEGPVWTDADGGYLVFSDIPASELKKWTAKDGVTTFRKPSNQTNGNTRDREGRLISCEHETRRVTRTEENGEVSVLADRCIEGRFNSPNDVVVAADGAIWFTDPTYGLGKGEKPELKGRYVVRLGADGKSTALMDGNFNQPNGLCFSPDGKKLYVADSGKPHHIRVFELHAANQNIDWNSGRVFCVIDNGVPDGIRCDSQGRIWSSAGDGVHIFAPDGKLIGKILVPESPANLCFGGKDNDTLFITARTSLYAVKINSTSK